MTTRKTGKSLNLPIVGALREHIETLPLSDYHTDPLHPRAFASLKGEKNRTGTLSNGFADLMAQAGLRSSVSHEKTGKGRSTRHSVGSKSFHSLRHTAVSLLKDAGIPDAVIMAVVGHQSAAMSQHYTHVGKEALSKAVKALPKV